MDKHDKTSDEKASSFIPRTPLAKRLLALRREVLASDGPLLSLEEIRKYAKNQECSQGPK